MARIVLVADDSPTIQKRALAILKGEGFEVETVSNGVAAIKRLAVLHPVVILADVSMPGRDGYEVCEFVKKSAELSHVPVLLVASDMEPYDDARGAEVRADGIIKKPFEAHELISVVMKFAQQFEAATPTMATPFVQPAAPEPTREFAFSVEEADRAPTVVQATAPEPAPDFAVSSENSDYVPTLVQHAPPDFPAVSEGVAFAEPTLEETAGYSTASQAAEMDMSYSAPHTEAETHLGPSPSPEFVDTFPAPETQSAPAAETPLVGEEPADPTLFAPPPTPPAERTPTFLEGLEAATPEPVFIEEPPAQTFVPSHTPHEFRTMIFRAPLEIAEPVWRDETVSAPLAPEPAGPTAPEPQLEAEAAVASPETPVDQPHEPPHTAFPVSATSLDSFSLDDATAGQVYFASEVVEAAPVEFVPSEVTPVEAPTLEVAPAEVASAEAALAEVAPVQSAPVEVAHSAPVEEAPATEFAPPEPAPEVVYSEIAPPEAAAEAAPPEPAAEVAAPPLAFDWHLFYTVIHKVVVRMSPPVLPVETVEEIARRLADEIASEIISESSQPPA